MHNVIVDVLYVMPLNTLDAHCLEDTDLIHRLKYNMVGAANSRGPVLRLKSFKNINLSEYNLKEKQ